MTEVDCPTPEATWALGERLGERAVEGTVVALIGTLGAGKTLFSRAVGAGLGVQTRVQSPTFVILQAHRGGRLPLWHADLYRLDDPEELDQLGLDEVLEGQGVVLVEWADKHLELLPDDRLEIRFEHTGAEARRLRLQATGPRHQALEQAVAG